MDNKELMLSDIKHRYEIKCSEFQEIKNNFNRHLGLIQDEFELKQEAKDSFNKQLTEKIGQLSVDFEHQVD